MTDLLQTITNFGLYGLVHGMLLFLVSAGLTVVFGMMNVLSITHASFYMLGAYFAFSLIAWNESFWLAYILAPIGVGIVGYAVERFMLNKVHTMGHFQELLLTLGLFSVIAELVKLAWGDYPRPSMIPRDLVGKIVFLGVEVPFYHLFIIANGIIVLGALVYIFRKTRIGMMLRAIVSNAGMVNTLGVNTRLVFLYVFAASSWLAGLSGVVTAPFTSTDPNMANSMLIDILNIIIVGGVGNIYGAFVASMLIAELQSFGVLLIPRFALVLQYIVFVVVLILRPRGLLGEKE